MANDDFGCIGVAFGRVGDDRDFGAVFLQGVAEQVNGLPFDAASRFWADDFAGGVLFGEQVKRLMSRLGVQGEDERG